MLQNSVRIILYSVFRKFFRKPEKGESGEKGEQQKKNGKNSTNQPNTNGLRHNSVEHTFDATEMAKCVLKQLVITKRYVTHIWKINVWKANRANA